ncbi:MAG: TrbG/VirB9 family P-type conjugative transfer protein [Acetobacteraceae bacterium]
MNRRSFVAMLLAASLPAHAEQNPTPVKQDSRIRVVEYDPNNVVAIQMASGRALTIELPPGEQIVDVALSDTKHIQRATRADNILFLKAMADVDAQPAFLKVRREDGTQKTYVFQLSAKEGANAPYLVRFTDPAADRAKAAAAWQAREAARRQAEAEAALRRIPRTPNGGQPGASYNSGYTVYKGER